MDVQCERCKTEYEFDDALVSGRGTTVKCTNCGLQFKVRPAGDAAETERWVVHTTRGQELVFTSLRDLQRAITTHEVGRGDTLRRGNAPPRTLGTIAELEPFFLARPSRSERPPPLDGGKSRMPTLRPPSSAAVPPSSQPARLAPLSVDRNAPAYSEAGTMVAPVLPPITAPPVVSREPTFPPPRLPRPAATPSFDPPTVPVQQGLPVIRDYDDSLSDAEPQYSPVAPRRRMGGWIVAAVLLVGVGVVGYRVAAPYLATAAKPPAHKLDARAEKFLNDGEAAFRDGNLELAKENFDKASALDDADPRVLLDVARLATARADIPWLRTRLLPESAADDLRTTKQQLADLSAAARTAADAAVAAAPADDVGATRVKVDSLRIAGEHDTARSFATKVGAASTPESAYVLAALDLSEIDPIWTTVLDRLRTASAGEHNPGRATAALVYALARSGDAATAKQELDRLRASPSHYPLVPELASFVSSAHAKGKAAPLPSASAAPAPSAVAAVDVNSLPKSTGGGGGGGEEPSGGDSRDIMKQAASAENKGQFSRATKLYEEAASADPSNSEALAGLGSVALKTGDFASARSYFGRAIHVNPNFVPALVGQADAMWAEGDHAGAVARYKEIVDRFPESSGFPSYVKTRAEGSVSGTTPPAATAEATPAPKPEPPATAAAPAPKAPVAPGTSLAVPANVPSDLPGTPP